MATGHRHRKGGTLARFFPVSMMANTLLTLLISIVLYLIIGGVLGWAAAVVNSILPFLSIIFIVIDVYVVIGIILSVLRFLRAV